MAMCRESGRSLISYTIILFLYLQEEFTDKTGYTIMFGPDKCGEDSKVSLFSEINLTVV